MPPDLDPSTARLVAQLARQAGCHAYLAYCAARLHYQPPVPREPRDELAELQRSFVASVGALQQQLAQIQALGGQVPLVAGLKAVA